MIVGFIKRYQPYVHQANEALVGIFSGIFLKHVSIQNMKKANFMIINCDSWDKPYHIPDNPKNPSHGKIRKLSVTVTLSDPKEYKGGELEFDFRNNDF